MNEFRVICAPGNIRGVPETMVIMAHSRARAIEKATEAGRIVEGCVPVVRDTEKV